MSPTTTALTGADGGGLGGVFGAGKKKAGKPIAYAKFKATDFSEPNPTLQWI